MENNFNKFRKAKIGGFNRKDVIDYIEKIQNEFYNYKKETDETVSRLREKIAELESLTDNSCSTSVKADAEDRIVSDSEKSTESCPADEITLATSKLKNVTDELCNSLNEFIDRLSENSIPVVLNVPFEEEELEDDADLTEEFEEEIVLSKVESILMSASSIFLTKNEEKNENNDNNRKCAVVKKDINNILDKAGFVC